MRQVCQSLSVVAVTICALSWPDQVLAEIVLDSADRAFYVEADTTTDNKGDDQFFKRSFFHFDPLVFTLPASAGIDNASAMSVAEQQSTISADLFDAHGTTNVSATSTRDDVFVSGFAETYYAVFFTVTKPTLVRLTGFVTATEDADAELQLEDPNFDLLFDYYVSDGETEQFNETILIDPGFYTFSTGTQAGLDYEGIGEWSSGGEFSVQLAIIPEPSAGVMLVVLSLGAYRRRR